MMVGNNVIITLKEMANIPTIRIMMTESGVTDTFSTSATDFFGSDITVCSHQSHGRALVQKIA